ncbi:bifunctional adenosylcobinamide kinase/adenosylcobinamide-phosphate guanylyltransferase [candidate division KSB3 bacterium]|uniref:Adenosylcobinamide kinase n=1 Tax=candidate division KSB3 bacterium TaxID=2044937 RepID=A0A2G6EFT8_9BACT|nr:MAG: bifunctional adenosylcobinamide kinase/adenosylcobinamide-phosphate guanylyltransferase [candidate division KSB3 bacterium]PIE31110.1 MAG: bifunctional adenosylcobinamide kinase/adenosylcobinamide-phosphate guanylyltransferase [candidate division KSB3 bacterium]
MARIICVTGGARSGKSRFAESFYAQIDDVVYIATCQPSDDEMRARVALHRRSRPASWKTFEGSHDLDRAVSTQKHYLLDCLSLLCSNIMFKLSRNDERISPGRQQEIETLVLQELRRLISAIRDIQGMLLIVTNEVGLSIVPEHHISRVYRDILGRVNQAVAALCDEVYLVVCGIPVKIK